ncbi:ATP-binding protein [Flavobacterium branchiarum]|uniref:AAA family ATPase n=1 Tax=Flavobacterium branchiarum TaxID=1114870 RepID=A0ABV5FPW2_9FLAO|nr:ATP-binding protein [Flavobacterium branchiarum]MDN3673110.1 ATP-binding protein [Flavobacterium branchiarum]
METTTKTAIVATLKQYMDTHKLKAADVAKKSGIRKEYLNTILKESSDFMYDAGNKKGLIPSPHFHTLAEFCGYSFDKVYWETQATPQTISILANLKDAKQHGITNVFFGETGSGKTHTVGLFASKNPHDIFVVTVGSSDNLGDLIEKIVDQLKITTGKTKSAKIRDISKKMRELKAQGYTPQLIFDEAEYMKQPALCAMKELYDNLQNYCSIVLVGTDQLRENLDKLRKRNKPGIPQFYRRIKFGIRVLPNIDRSYAIFLKDLQDKNLKKFLQRNCANYGELHDCLVPAMRESDRTQEPLTEQLVRKVLNIPDNMYV